LFAAIALVTGCAGGEMSRFGDADGVFSSSGDSSDEGDASAATDPTAADDGADGGPTTAPATDDGADDTPVTTDPTDASTSGNDDTTGAAETSSTDPTDPSTTSESSSGAVDTGIGDSVDLSGWTIVQTMSDRELELPAGTVVPLGGTLVVARDSS